MPTKIVKRTLAATTQYARYPQSQRLKKMFNSPFPACNVPRRSEATATDTVYSDTPAIGTRETMAQLFVGCETMVTNIYGMMTERQFVNMLQDMIRKQGAMDKLLSD